MNVVLSKNEIPLVSVCMTAYNQAAYIIDAIEGVLMQQTNFRFELLIGEDYGNKDDTLRICREYEQKYSDIIKVVYDGHNHGMVANEQRLIDAAKGKYIAFCEADDYWIDPLKLQKQVKVLESNTQYSACACQSRVIYENNKKDYYLLNGKAIKDSEISFLDIINNRSGFQTASFIFRSCIIKNVDPIPITINGWDRAVFILCSLKGNIYWLKEDMAVYRKNKDGISSRVNYALMKKDVDIIPWFKSISNKSVINDLKSHVYYAIMLNSIKLNFIHLLYLYVLCNIYIHRSSNDLKQLQSSVVECFNYKLPWFVRRIKNLLLR